MKFSRLVILWLLSLSFSAWADDVVIDDSGGKAPASIQAMFLNSLVGSWEGSCRTWFQPGKLADESQVRGEFQPVLGGRFIRHHYEGKIKGRRRSGEELIAFNGVSHKFQITWIDDFHMNYGILFSQGHAITDGFEVTGAYDVGPDAAPWGWKTRYQLSDKDHLTISAYNILPDGSEVLAVETQYTRVPNN